jgi:hypothetical protein
MLSDAPGSYPPPGTSPKRTYCRTAIAVQVDAVVTGVD